MVNCAIHGKFDNINTSKDGAYSRAALDVKLPDNKSEKLHGGCPRCKKWAKG